jgi:hypothetical protein
MDGPCFLRWVIRNRRSIVRREPAVKSHRITIAFPTARAENIFHQILNFAEDLDDQFRRARGAKVENPNNVPDGNVYVAVVSDGKLRPTLRIIRTHLEAHLLTGRSKVIVSPGVES